MHTCVPTATIHGVPYTVNSHVVVGAIYAYMCTYSYHTRCTIHGELTCGGGGNIRIHVYLQLLYTVHHTWCTVHGVLTCGGGSNIRIHVYLQLPYMVYCTRCTVHGVLTCDGGGNYMHTCVPTATVHGAPYMVYRTRCTVHSVPYTVNSRVEGAFTCGSYSRVQGTFTCGSYSRVRRATKVKFFTP